MLGISVFRVANFLIARPAILYKLTNIEEIKICTPVTHGEETDDDGPDQVQCYS